MGIFHTILDTFVPLRRVYSRKSKRPTPWFSTVISNLIKLKNRAKKRADQSKAESDQVAYKKHKNKLKHVIRQAKLDYLQTSFARSKSHPTFAELWSRINGVLNRSTSPTRADVSITPEVLNDFFQNIAVGSSHQPATSFILLDDDTDFSFNEISVDKYSSIYLL